MLSRFSCVCLFVIGWTVAHQAPLSMGFSRQEYWSGLPFPSPGDPPNPVINPLYLMSPELTGGFFTTSATWETLVWPLLFLKCRWLTFVRAHAASGPPVPLGPCQPSARLREARATRQTPQRGCHWGAHCRLHSTCVVSARGQRLLPLSSLLCPQGLPAAGAWRVFLDLNWL